MMHILNYRQCPVIRVVVTILPLMSSSHGAADHYQTVQHMPSQGSSLFVHADQDFNDLNSLHEGEEPAAAEAIFSPKSRESSAAGFIGIDIVVGEGANVPLEASMISATNLSRLSERTVELETLTESRVLSIDGGGIKGLMVLELLALMEAKTGKHTTNFFDMIGGTSAGALIATLLTIRDPETGKPKYTARSLKNALMEHYPNFFVTKRGSCCGLLKEKYKVTPARQILDKLAGDALFGDAIIPTFVTAFNVSGESKYHKLSILGSYIHKDAGKTVVDVALSSMSAPVFFKPHLSSDGNIYLDGGLIANNPSLMAYCQAKKNFQHSSRMVLLSMGAGSFDDPASSRKLCHTGLIDIGPELPDMFLQAQQSITQETLSHMPDVSSFRIDPMLEGKKIELDDTSQKAMDHLSVAALRWWGDNPSKIDEILRRLKRS